MLLLVPGQHQIVPAPAGRDPQRQLIQVPGGEPAYAAVQGRFPALQRGGDQT